MANCISVMTEMLHLYYNSALKSPVENVKLIVSWYFFQQNNNAVCVPPFSYEVECDQINSGRQSLRCHVTLEINICIKLLCVFLSTTKHSLPLIIVP